MWDVIWTDPDRELVGEHKARKGRKREERLIASPDDRSRASCRSSLSTQSSVSSSDAAPSFLQSHKGSFRETVDGRRTGKEICSEGKGSWRSSTWSKASSTASSALASLSIPSVRSPLSPTFDIRSRRSSGLANTNESSMHSRPSIKSRSEEDDVGDEKVKDLAQVGLMSRKNEDANVERKSLEPDKQERCLPGHFSVESDDGPNLQSPLRRLVQQSSASSRVAVKEDLESSHMMATVTSERLPLLSPTSYNPPAVPPKSPLRSAFQNHSLMSLPGNARDWLSPSEWSQCASSYSMPDALTDPGESSVLNAETLREEIKRLCAADSARILVYLQESRTEKDATRGNMAKKWWFLSTLQHPDRRAKTLSPEDDKRSDPVRSRECVILFESQHTAACLSVVHPDDVFYHVSRHPLRNATFTNLIPLSLSSLSVDVLSPALPLGLDLIYSTSLQTLCPAPDLVRTLVCLRSCLKPEGGTLKLTLIDVLPHHATLGPKLRAWFEKHLLVNLAPYSLSHTPTCLFPRCLAAASLRGSGSKRVKTRFFASPESLRGSGISEEAQRHADHDPDPAIRRLRSELCIKAELRCLVGRMIWTEVWGSYVSPRVGGKCAEGDGEKRIQWWFEDEECMAECLQLGTFWEYHDIEAVRES